MRCLSVPLLVLAIAFSLNSQTLQRRPEKSADESQPAVNTVPLLLAAGTPIKVTLDRDIRIRRKGQPIDATIEQPLYSFDKLLVPAGAKVKGKIASIEDVGKTTRTLAAMNADFSPERKVRIEFDRLVLPDGQSLNIHTQVSPGTGVMQFVPAAKNQGGKSGEGKEALGSKLAQARRDLHSRITTAKEQITAPRKLHRLERLALAQSPYRPQYMNAGTSFNAELQEPLSFGSEVFTADLVSNIGSLPDQGAVIHTWLRTPLTSSSSKPNDLVEAVVSEPLIVQNQIYIPEGSVLKGTVIQVRRARRFGRNGQLRIAFHELVPPQGVEHEIEATLEGLEVAGGENLALDSEGGAQVKTPKSRYLKTGITVVLAAGSGIPDEDNGGVHGGINGGAGGGAVNGASGFKLVGTVVGLIARSQTLTAGMGAYGAAHSVYSHFLARGRDVVYPKDMSMVLALGNRPGQSNHAGLQ